MNQEQQEVANKFFDFLISDNTEFHIFGGGGVGKTYMIKYLLTEGLNKYASTCKLLGMPNKLHQYALTATTHKAVEVLSNNTKEQCATVYSFYHLIVKDNYRTGEQELVPLDPSFKIYNTLVFIDECSMLNRQTVSYIRNHSEDCKIVYVGDPSQLAPVNSKMMWTYVDSPVVGILSNPVRNAGQPALQLLCDQLKNSVATRSFQDIQTVPNVIELLDDNAMQQKLLEHFVQSTKDSKILAYTNAKCLQYIDWIKKKKGLTNTYYVNRPYINNSTVELRPGVRIYPEQEVFITRISTPTRFTGTNANLQVLYCDLLTRRGSLLKDIPVAEDPEARQSVLKLLKSAKRINEYLNVKNQVADLREPMAMTIHKSQGSTYDTVFLDLESFIACRSPDTAARLLYVALTRARDRVYLYGQLPSKYGRVI